MRMSCGLCAIEQEDRRSQELQDAAGTQPRGCHPQRPEGTNLYMLFDNFRHCAWTLAV